MAFAISTRHLPRITSYEAGVEHFTRIKPIRGTDIRPVGDRRAKHMRIEVGADSMGEWVGFSLYNTTVVKHYDSGRIEIDARYASQSTARFANCFLPRRFSLFLSNNKLVLSRRDADQWRYFYSPGKYVIVDDEVQGVEPVYKRRTDCSKARAARATIAPFKAWLGTTGQFLLKTMTMESSEALREQYGRSTYWSDDSLLEMATSDDADQWAAFFISQVYYSSWSGRVHHRLTSMINRLDTLLLQRHDAYYFEPLPVGEIPQREWYTRKQVEERSHA